MSCCGAFKEEFQPKKFKVSHDQPHRFVEWQGTGVSWIYTIYRVVIAVYFTCVMIYSWTIYKYVWYKWIIYLTNVSMVWIVLSTNILAINAVWHHINSSKNPDKPLYTTMTVLMRIEWVMFTVMSVVNPMVTALYWGIVYKAEWGISLVNFTTHAVNSIYLAVDLFVNGVPLQILHYYQPLVYAFVYSLFTVIYWAAGGTGEHGGPIYEILDYEEGPGQAVGVLVLLLLVIGPILMLIVYAIHKIKLLIYDSCCNSSVDTTAGNAEEMTERKEENHSV